MVLGAQIDLRNVAGHPAMIGLALALAFLTAAVHLVAPAPTQERPASGLIASAQLGVPAAVSLAVCAAGTIMLERSRTALGRIAEPSAT